MNHTGSIEEEPKFLNPGLIFLPEPVLGTTNVATEEQFPLYFICGAFWVAYLGLPVASTLHSEVLSQKYCRHSLTNEHPKAIFEVLSPGLHLQMAYGKKRQTDHFIHAQEHWGVFCPHSGPSAHPICLQTTRVCCLTTEVDIRREF